MYKAQLREDLLDDHKWVAEKYMQARDGDPDMTEHWLEMMEMISKNIKYVTQMMDGTIGKDMHITAAQSHPMVRT